MPPSRAASRLSAGIPVIVMAWRSALPSQLVRRVGEAKGYASALAFTHLILAFSL
jgi:hypothetical protein